MTLPEDSIGSTFSVVNIVEKHLQLLVIIKVSSDDGANGRGRGKAWARNILSSRTSSGVTLSDCAKLLLGFLTRNSELLPCRNSLWGPFQLP